MISLLLLCTAWAAQEPIDEKERLKPLLPAPTETTAKPEVSPPTSPPQQPGARTLGPAQPLPMGQGMQFPDAPAMAAATGPRPLPQDALPFSEDRPLLRVDGIEISSGEINELVRYSRSYRQGRSDLQLISAVADLLPCKVMESHFATDLAGMEARILEASKALANGEDFQAVVKRVSNDDEAPSDDGRYTFGRDRAVEPFDRLTFTTATGTVTPPFLTVYGYHILETLEYVRGAKPDEDESTVRHILVMYPGMVELDEQGTDVRKWIKARVREARIEVLEPGMENLVPAKYRSQIVPTR